MITAGDSSFLDQREFSCFLKSINITVIDNRWASNAYEIGFTHIILLGKKPGFPTHPTSLLVEGTSYKGRRKDLHCIKAFDETLK